MLWFWVERRFLRLRMYAMPTKMAMICPAGFERDELDDDYDFDDDSEDDFDEPLITKMYPPTGPDKVRSMTVFQTPFRDIKQQPISVRSADLVGMFGF